MKQEAFLPSTPSKEACLQPGHRRRRSGLPGEFTPMAGLGRRTEARGQVSEARLPASDFRLPASGLTRLLELFVFYNGRVPGLELSAEDFDVRRLEKDGFIFRARNPFDFGSYLIGPELKKYAAFAGVQPLKSNFQTNNNLTLTKQNKHEDKS